MNAPRQIWYTNQVTVPTALPSAPSSTYPVIPPLHTTIPPEISNPAAFRPLYGQVKTEVVWKYYSIKGWMTKHIPPSYSFSKTRKLRYVVLADRMVYTFKTDSPTPFYREFFELTGDTDVFVSNYLSGVMYCIEVSKRDHRERKSWYLQCEDSESMKLWLDRLKKTVSWLRSCHGSATSSIVAHGTAQQHPQEQDQEQQRSFGINSSSSDSILSAPSSPTFLPISVRRNTHSTDDTDIVSTIDPQDLFYADEYDKWEPPHPIARHAPRRTKSISHCMQLPPQQPPPRFAPPPPPLSQKFHV
ncbi:hypothetical protein BX666DRAFT_1908432 [Dichotomocladium elegans]|nr:hypothetical protein BX666DRAFT_1908432 [Dichotomocladium elegans]